MNVQMRGEEEMLGSGTHCVTLHCAVEPRCVSVSVIAVGRGVVVVRHHGVELTETAATR
jgi:hypothetical protein